MANKYKNGDVVELISGGPSMTISESPGDTTAAYPHKVRSDYLCEWFKGATPSSRGYPEHVLKPYVPPKK